MSPSTPATPTRYVALGDSQTEGVGDEPHPDGALRGWADRFAALLASRDPRVLYANLAVRGRRISHVHDEQIDPAVALVPDLVSLVVGANDLIQPRLDVDAALGRVDDMHSRLRATGATVLTSTFPDVSAMIPGARLLRRRVAAFNDGLRRIAELRGSLLFEADHDATFGDPTLWCDDRLHFSPLGHRHFAIAMAGLVGLDPDIGSPAVRPASTSRRASRIRWARSFLVPWVGRRLGGRSSGDGRSAKRPQLLRVTAP